MTFRNEHWNDDLKQDHQSIIPRYPYMSGDQQLQINAQAAAKVSEQTKAKTEIDLSHIDSLLAVNLNEVEDLGEELFQMLDRFIKAIRQFEEDYTKTIHEKDKALRSLENDLKKQLEGIETTHNQDKETYEKKKKDDIKKQIQEVTQKKSERARQLNQANNALQTLISEKKDELQKLKDEHNASLKKIKKEVLEEVSYFHRLGKKWVEQAKVSSMGKIEKKVREEVSQKQFSSGQIDNYLSSQNVNEAEAFYTSIKDTFENLFRRKKLEQLWEQFCVLYEQTNRAYQDLAAGFRKEEEKKETENQSEIKRKEKEIRELEGKNKDADSKDDDNLEKEIRGIETGCSNSCYRKDLEAEDEKAEATKDSKAKKEKIEKEWEQAFVEREETFKSSMNVSFPRDSMEKLYTELERIVNYIDEPFASVTEPKRFIAIGKAFVPFCHEDMVKYPKAYALVCDWIRAQYPFMLADPNSRLLELSAPYLITVDRGAALLIKYNDTSEKTIRDIVNGIGIRMLWSVPASLQEFCLVDAESTRSFSELISMDPAQREDNHDQIKSMIIKNTVLFRDDEISTVIGDLRTRFTKKAVSMVSATTLRQYNDHNPMNPEAYQAIMIQHFPGRKVDANSIDNIKTMLIDNREIGFSTILTMSDTNDNNMAEDAKNSVQELIKYTTVLRLDSTSGLFTTASQCVSDAEKRAKISIFPVPRERFDEMKNNYYEAAKRAQEALANWADFTSIMPKKETWYQFDSSEELIIPLGFTRGGLGRQFELRMNDTNYVHTVISGETGSGKSNLLHALLLNTMLRYSDNEAEIYLIDFKHGADFSIYGNYNLPNLRVLSLASKAPELALALLEEVAQKCSERSGRLSSYHGIYGYNQDHPESRMSRIILIIDELYTMLEDSKADNNLDTAKEIIRILKTIANQGRAFGIHMVLSSQNISSLEISDIIAQSANRIVMTLIRRKESIDALLMGKDSNTVSAFLNDSSSTKKGSCIFTTGPGEKDIVQAYTAWSDGEELQTRLLKEISDHYAKEQNRAYTRVLLTEPSICKNHPFSLFAYKSIIPDQSILNIGVPMTLEKDFEYLPDQNSLWVIGGDSTAENAGYSVMFYTLLSLLLIKLHNKDEQFEILCTDGSDGQFVKPDENNRFWQICNTLQKKGSSLIHYFPASGISQNIQSLAEIIRRRKDGNESSYPIWFLISLLERYNNVSYDDRRNLETILSDGPKYGIHTVFWTKNAEATNLLFSFIRDGATHYDKLILETDLKSFGISITKENKPKGYKARMQSIGCDMDLRLYNLPMPSWIEELLKELV